MPLLIEPAAEFTQLTASEVMEALQDPNPGNPIAVEVARLMGGYMVNYKAYMERIGEIPSEIVTLKPRSDIEAVAMQLTIDMLRELPVRNKQL